MLAGAWRSALRQHDVELEVIVVDEASTDDTSAFLAAVGDDRVRVTRHDQPWGPSAARNDGAASSAEGFARRLRRLETENTFSGDAWIATAMAWLRVVEGCGLTANEQMPTPVTASGKTSHS